MNTINTEEYSSSLRSKGINLSERKILITNFSGSDQEKDLSEPANCYGFGRIRHFKQNTGIGWPLNPLPIVPAAKHLELNMASELKAQVFQNSICNWRCWYCYVDYKLLSGNKKYAKFLSCEELLDFYSNEVNPAQMIDLSGGQPDLTPEWVPWMMEALENKGLSDKVFLWSDDNLSNDYFWRYLTPTQIEKIDNYKLYSRVVCFKGIDAESFHLNTMAELSRFENQFQLFKELRRTKIDLYAYVTLTCPSSTNVELAVPKFLDRIQHVDPLFPLRIVPLRIFNFTPSKNRHFINQEELLAGQQAAIVVWERELKRRFSDEQLNRNISEIY